MGGKSEIRDNISYHIAEVHASVSDMSQQYLKEERRYNYTTPKSFLELINFYKHLLKLRRTEQVAAINRLDTGLNTLMRTKKDVEQLQVFLKEKQKVRRRSNTDNAARTGCFVAFRRCWPTTEAQQQGPLATHNTPARTLK